MIAVARPFSNPVLWVADPIRIICVAMGLVVMLMAVRMMVNPARRTYAKATVWGILACMALCFTAVVTEAAKIGYHVTWRLAFNVVGLSLAANYLRLLTDLPVDGRHQYEPLANDPSEDAVRPPVATDDASRWFVRFGIFIVVGTAVASLAATVFSAQVINKLNANWDKAFVYHQSNAQHICQVLVKLEPKATCTIPKP